MRDIADNTVAAGEGIYADGVTVTYRNGLTALTDASFAIPQGTITALVGVNGAGKSTLFKAIMGKWHLKILCMKFLNLQT